MKKDFRLIGTCVFLIVVTGLIVHFLVHEPAPRPRPPAPKTDTQAPRVVEKPDHAEESTGTRQDLAEISGHVTDNQGNPVEGARVQASGGQKGASTTTAQDGSFTLRLAAGSYDIRASKRDAGSAYAPAVATGTSDLALALAFSEAVTGQVVEAATGAPVTSFEVAVVEAPPIGAEMDRISKGVTWIATNDNNGRFRIESTLGKSPVLVVARAQGYAPAFARTGPALPGQPIEPVVLALSPGKSVQGTVTDEAGSPIPNASIHIGLVRKGGGDTRTDQWGQFTLSSLPSQDTELSVIHPDYVPQSVMIPREGATSPLTIVLEQGGTIEGFVRTAQRPQPNCGITVVPETGESLVPLSAVTEQDGHYMIEHVPAGQVSVQASIDHTHQITHDVTVENGAGVTVDFDFPGAHAVVEGSVTMGGQPVLTGRVLARVSSPSGEERLAAAIESGSYHIENVPAGRVILEVEVRLSTGAQERSEAEFDAGEGEIIRRDFSFDSVSGIKGIVSGMNADENGMIVALQGEYDLNEISADLFPQFQSLIVAQKPIGRDGSFRLDGLPPGSYTIAVVTLPKGIALVPEALASARGTSRTATIPEGQEVEVNLTVK